MHDIREERPQSYPQKFEDVYPHYEFSVLVRIAVLAAEQLCRFLRDRRVRRAMAARAQPHRDRHELIPPARRMR